MMVAVLGFVTVAALAIRRSDRAVALRICHRLNIKRAADSRNFLVIYQADASRFGSLVWVPLTDCAASVDRNLPARQPVRFSVRLPGANDLTVGPRN